MLFLELELHHIQSRPVISRKNSHSRCVRAFYPTLVTSTKVPVVNMLFTKITKRPASNHIFPQISHYIRGFGVFFTAACLSCSFISCQSPSVPTAPHPGERLPSWKPKTDDVSNVSSSFNIFFLPFWQVASVTVNQERAPVK